MRIQNKKADTSLVSKTTITLIILILSFGVILYFWFDLNLTKSLDTETCHTSVILKKAMIDKPILGGKLIDLPLNCTIQKVCLTSSILDKGCEDDFGKKYAKIKVSSRDDIIKTVANSMVECWKMMGESKGGMVFSREFLSLSQTSNGVMCKVIAFSDDIKQKYPSINAAEFNFFMNANKIPAGEVTYNQFLTDSSNPTVVVSADSLSGGKISTSDPLAIVFVEYEKQLFARALGGASGALGGAALVGAAWGSVVPVVGTGVGAAIGLVVVLGTGYAGGNMAEGITDSAFDTFSASNDARYYSSLYVVPYTPKNLQGLKLSNFQNIQNIKS